MAEDIGLQSAMAWAFATLSTFDSFAGDYDHAEVHLDRSEMVQTNPFQQVGAGDSWLQLTRTRALVVLLLGREQYDEATPFLETIWRQACDTFSLSYMTMCMPIVAILEWHMGNFIRATELIGLTFAQPESGIGWMQHWHQLTQVREALQAELGDEAYHEAWTAGEQFDLVEIAIDIADSFWTE